MINKDLRESYTEKLRKVIHPFVIKVLSIRRSFKLEVVGTIPKNQQFIFVANHWCIDDIPTAGEVIGSHFYVLVSNEDRYTFDGLALELNGVVWTNRMDKSERGRAKNDLLRHLKLGHNILMYPEGTWNLSPNLPMLTMNYGCISMSLETGVPILPIYLHFKDDVCKVEINEPFYATEDKVYSISRLRDIMATSAWNFYEQEDVITRNELNTNYWEENIAKRYAKYSRARKDPVGVRQFESHCIYRPKGQVTYEEAFSHLNTIIPTEQNLFLFNKRLKG